MAGSVSEPDSIIYVVEAVRDDKMVHDFVLFTYRQAHPTVSRNFIIVGLVSLALIYGLRIPQLTPVMAGLGIFCLLMGLFRHLIPISSLKRHDEDYINKNLLRYEFSESGIRALRNGEEFLSIDNYAKVNHLYHDECYYYLGANESDLMILPKNGFVTGASAEFADYICDKAGIGCNWCPANRKDRRRQERKINAEKAARAMEIQQEMKDAQAAEMQRRKELLREAREKRNKHNSKME